MSFEEQQQLICDRIKYLALEQDLEIIEVKITGHSRDAVIQVLADQLNGSISIQQCSRLNHSIVEAIDKEGILSEDGYSLEVSSPGLDRPLVTYKDFLRNINAEVSVFINEQIPGKKEFKGVVFEVTEEVLKLKTGKENKEITIPISQITKGLLVI